MLNWSNLNNKQKYLCLFYSFFISIWMVFCIFRSWKGNDITLLGELAMPFSMLCFLLNPSIFTEKPQLNFADSTGFLKLVYLTTIVLLAYMFFSRK
jgi:hypothetical protein